MTEKQWSGYQEEIFRAVTEDDAHLVIEAVAGSGKSTTLVEACHRYVARYPRAKVCFVAFNKHVADELPPKLPKSKRLEVRTMHSLGLRVLAKEERGLNVNEDKLADWFEEDFENPFDPLNPRLQTKDYTKAIKKYVGYFKNLLLEPTRVNLEYVRLQFDIGDPADVDDKNAFARSVVAACAKYMEECLDDYIQIDFDDMVWLPARLELPMPQYDLVFVDETQDLNPTMHKLVMMLGQAGARVVAVGDSYQSMYRFRGAQTDSMGLLRKQLGATTLPLSITYRCPVQHVTLAQTFVPYLEAAPNAAEGRIEALNVDEGLRRTSRGDLVIGRTNVEVARAAMKLLKTRRPAMINGKDTGKSLVALIRSFRTARDVAHLISLCHERLARMKKRGAAPKEMEAFSDKVSVLGVLADDTSTLSELISLIQRLFSDKAKGIVCSTIHRVKGLEADNVLLLGATSLPRLGFYHRSPGFGDEGDYYAGEMEEVREKSGSEEEQQERNILYVALTRAKKVLRLVVGRDKNGLPHPWPHWMEKHAHLITSGPTPIDDAAPPPADLDLMPDAPDPNDLALPQAAPPPKDELGLFD